MSNLRAILCAAFATLLLIGGIGGCAVTDGGYGAVGVSYGGGMYEPYGYEPFGFEYGGWGPGYVVGPGRGSDGRRRGQDRPHSYRTAPVGRQAPSIPHRSRSH